MGISRSGRELVLLHSCQSLLSDGCGLGVESVDDPYTVSVQMLGQQRKPFIHVIIINGPSKQPS